MASVLPPPLTFDARPMLAAGEEPLTAILEAATALADGQTLEVLAPFEPVPLLDLLGRRGFRTACEERDADTWSARFTRVAIDPSLTIRDVLDRHPATAAVFAEYGLDGCCGAGRTLGEAVDAHGLVWTELHAALDRAAG